MTPLMCKAFIFTKIIVKISWVCHQRDIEKKLETLIVEGQKFNLNQCPKNNLEPQVIHKISDTFVVGSLPDAQECTCPNISYVIEVSFNYAGILGSKSSPKYQPKQ